MLTSFVANVSYITDFAQSDFLGAVLKMERVVEWLKLKKNISCVEVKVTLFNRMLTQSFLYRWNEKKI